MQIPVKYLFNPKEKLVRDRIPEILREKGIKVKNIRVVEGEEFYFYLKKKLVEEVIEFLEEDKKEELADILEVIEAICKFKNWDIKEIYEIKNKKALERGKFNKKIVIEF